MELLRLYRSQPILLGQVAGCIAMYTVVAAQISTPVLVVVAAVVGLSIHHALWAAWPTAAASDSFSSPRYFFVCLACIALNAVYLVELNMLQQLQSEREPPGESVVVTLLCILIARVIVQAVAHARRRAARPSLQ